MVSKLSGEITQYRIVGGPDLPHGGEHSLGCTILPITGFGMNCKKNFDLTQTQTPCTPCLLLNVYMMLWWLQKAIGNARPKF